ncbi:putative ribonuclease h-like domain-containing protein [Phytophthora infestans]|uniref:Putative ribonuclease h-like domain-containing protein n=1 Tax=Phytophthora infestans TaxID=4787 RepID=A0A8S9VAE4_PHYIN|nr:putative ribonuclease h-like domain-containing protein [Phytophthora infestans]
MAKDWVSLLLCARHEQSRQTSIEDVIFADYSEASAAVSALNGSSSKWLKRARDLMVKMYGNRLSLCSLCIIRWNSMQACFASLLRVQSALQMLTKQSHGDDEFPTALSVVLRDYFWQDLKRAERVIAPLSLASYRLQRDRNTVGDVIQSFGAIYLGFKQAPQHREELVACVEQRWKKCE